jgi:exodeoxyribonuclease VII small subunit
MATKKQSLTYQEASTALEAVLAKLQQPDIQVDEAVVLYEEGLALAKALEMHLQQAENNIKKLKLQASD